MMTSHGALTLGVQPPFGCYASDGTFVLTLLAHDAISISTKTAWRLTYAGPQAARFWHTHKDALQPGARVHVEAHKVWAFDSKQTGMELHAAVLEMTLSGCRRNLKQNETLAGELIALAV